jgi:hypothetical protein
MKHTEQEIKEIAKQSMKDIDWDYDKQKEISVIFKSKDEEIKIYEKMKNHPKYNEVIATLRNYWTIGFDFEPEAELEYNSMFMHVDDDTAEPFSIRHKQAIFKILKNSEGKYYTELER